MSAKKSRLEVIFVGSHLDLEVSSSEEAARNGNHYNRHSDLDEVKNTPELPQMKRKNGCHLEKPNSSTGKFAELGLNVPEAVILEYPPGFLDCCDQDLNQKSVIFYCEFIDHVCEEDRSSFVSQVSNLCSAVVSNNKFDSDSSRLNGNLGSSSKYLWRFRSWKGLEPVVANWNFLRRAKTVSDSSSSNVPSMIALDFYVECNSLLPKI